MFLVSAALASSYHALLIGISDYRDPNHGDLRSPELDMVRVGSVLGRHYGFSVRELGGAEATAARIRAELDRLSQLPEDATVLVYFSGHGVHPAGASDSYLLPWDAGARPDERWLSARALRDQVLAFRATQVLLVLDACYSGVTLDLKGVAGKGIVVMPAGEQATRLSASPRLSHELALEMRETKARYALTSGGDEPVDDVFRDAEYSVFAWSLATELETAPEGWRRGNELFDDVLLEVRRVLDQEPQYAPLSVADAPGEILLYHRIPPVASLRRPALRYQVGERLRHPRFLALGATGLALTAGSLVSTAAYAGERTELPWAQAQAWHVVNNAAFWAGVAGLGGAGLQLVLPQRWF